MFGLNEVVGKSFFNKVQKDELLVTSRFFTLQGEGPYRGQPAYFIRLAKCNLACSFCDTYFDAGDYLSFTALLEEATTVINDFYQQRNLATPPWAEKFPRKIVLVITGGEPSLQTQLPAFLELAQKYFTTTQIESNGILPFKALPPSTTLVVSPKCLEKAGKVERYLEPNSKTLERADCLKFVISAPEDERYAPYSTIPLWAHEWTQATGKPIFISPMNIYKNEPAGRKVLPAQGKELSLEERSVYNEVLSFWEPGLLDLKKNQRNHEYAAEYCLKHGLILNLQLHLFASLP